MYMFFFPNFITYINDYENVYMFCVVPGTKHCHLMIQSHKTNKCVCI